MRKWQSSTALSTRGFDMRILVTGGAGFLGSHLCQALSKRGHQVICIDNFSTGKKENLKGIDVEILDKDCNKSLPDLKNIDMIFHYAATVGVKRTQENPMLVFDDITGIRNILELGRRNDAKIVFASSSEVYGNPSAVPETEDGQIDPRQPYAAVKLIGEQLMRTYHVRYGLGSCSLRLFNVYGPRQISNQYGFVVGRFITQALKGDDLTVFGDGKQTRTFTFVDDNIELALRAMEKLNDGVVVNVGSDDEISILELANRIIKLTKSKSKVKYVKREEHDVVQRRCPDTTVMKRLLGYDLRYSLDDGLKKTIDGYASCQ
jgi:UDP-glucose 4-epimerase